MVSRFVFFLSTLSLIGTPCPGQQASAGSAPNPVSVVVVDRATLAFADTLKGLVIVVRDADLPDRTLSNSFVAIGPVGTDPRNGRGRRLTMGPNGQAWVTRADTGALTVLALNIGYQRFQFDIRFQATCRETLEIYIARHPTFFDGPPSPPPTPARAVLTTCSRP